MKYTKQHRSWDTLAAQAPHILIAKGMVWDYDGVDNYRDDERIHDRGNP